MNGKREEMEEEEEMKKEVENGGKKEKVVLMWGYLPGVSRQRSPVLSPTEVSESSAGDSWRDVCGGGCGFAMAVSESGKLYTWGSTDDMGQSYVAAGKHEEIPEAFPLPGVVSIVKAAAGWAHCAAVTASGDVYTWGWKECVPSGKAIGDQLMVGIPEKDNKQGGSFNDQVSPRSHVSSTRSNVSGAGGGTVPSLESNKAGEESAKRRRLSSAKRAPESSTSSEEALSAPPCLVTFDAGVRITAVAAGGRHTLALSAAYGKDRSSAPTKANANSEGQACKVVGSCVKAIACGGRHSAVITDSGAILTFGWGLYGQGRTYRFRHW